MIIKGVLVLVVLYSFMGYFAYRFIKDNNLFQNPVKLQNRKIKKLRQKLLKNKKSFKKVG